MNKMKKLLSVVLAVVLAFSALSVLGSAVTTNYKTVDDLTALNAYSPYGQVTRLSTEERTSIVFDALDALLAPMTSLNMGTMFSALGLEVRINFTSIDGICDSLDSIKDTFESTLGGLAMGILNLGIAESLETGTWPTGMTRQNQTQFNILSEILELLSNNTTLVGKVFTDGLDLGIISLGDMSSIEEIIFDLPGFIKGMIYPMIERWDDTLADIKMYDNSIAGTGDMSVEEIANERIKALFTDDMSITTIKYDVNGNMTSEHKDWVAKATGSAAPATPSTNSPRCYYQFSSTTPDSVMTVYHIVDAAEEKTLAEDNDDTNNVAKYNYIAEEQQYVMTEEVEGSGTYVWRATDEWNNVWSLKWYNDDSFFFPDFSGTDFDLIDMSASELFYTFLPVVFDQMAPVVLNGSVKKALAEFVGVHFTRVGTVVETSENAWELDAAAAAAIPDADETDAFFNSEQGKYLWEWSDYKVINGNHYYRFQDDIYAGDISDKNNYFDIINWDFKIEPGFLDEFIPAVDAGVNDRLLLNVADFLTKVANEVLLPTAETADTRSDYTATWTRPTFADGNANLVANVKALAQAVIGLAPQHIFGSDYAENPRCYYNLMMSTDNDTILTGIAAHLVNMIMPSMTLPAADQIVSSGAKVGAILAAVIREFAAYLVPEYNFDALIYTDFGTTDGEKNFVTGVDSEYWLDVCLTMGMNVGFEYLRAFADMGEGSDEWNAFVAYSGYGVDGKTYAAGTTRAQLNAEWEGMLDYLIDWALDDGYVTETHIKETIIPGNLEDCDTTNDEDTVKKEEVTETYLKNEWTWKMENLVDTSGLTIDLATAQDPWAKLEQILGSILPVDEILTVSTNGTYTTKIEKFLRYDLILGIVDLRWDVLLNTIQFNGDNKYFRTANILDQLAGILKGIVNSLFAKVGGGSYALIPSAITDFDSLANQSNLVTMIKNLVGVLYTAGVTNKGAEVLLPFLNFLLGWKTDPQVIAEPEIWTEFRDGNDYAFQWVDNGTYPNINDGATKIKIFNSSSGMLETHRYSSVTDHAYDINIKSITSDATVNTLTFDYDKVVSPYETIDVVVGGTYKGEEAVTVTIEYDYVGKDGKAVGGTQYTSLSFLVSNQYEDANVGGRFDKDDDEDYAGINQYSKYHFTEDIYTTVTEYKPEIYYVGATLSNPSKNFQYISAPNGGIDMTGKGATYFDYITDQTEAGWKSTLSKDGGSAYGKLYKAASGVTADTFSEENSEANNLYGVYDMGQVAVKYGSGEKTWNIDFIYYNSYGIYDIYTENMNNGYNANQGVDAAIYNEYNEAWKLIVYGATYPMMTEANGNAATDYVTTIQPYIPAAIERFEAAKEAYEKALAEAQATGAAGAAVPNYVATLEAELAKDDNDGEKEINFQDYEFYEYFNYADLRTAHRNFVKTYYAPEIMDTYYILGSGIREAELNNVIAAESNTAKANAITASRMENDAKAIADSITANAEWKMPVNSKLLVDDMTSRLAYYRSFVNDSVKEDTDHLYFLNQEIAFIDAQGLDETEYEETSWERFQDAYDYAKEVQAGTAKYANYNSTIYDAKWNLMVAYKELLLNSDSLIKKGGTADLLVNIAAAEEIFATEYDAIRLSDVAEEKGLTKDEALAALITALGYYYVGEDGNTWNLYENSAYEYADNDRPNRQSNQAKVDKANENLETAIAYFSVGEVADPELILTELGVEIGAVINTTYGPNDGFTGAVFGVDTLGTGYDGVTATLEEAYTTEAGYIVINTEATGGVETTGAVIELYNDDDVLVANYVFIYFGDVNRDGSVDTVDASFIEEYYAWIIDIPEEFGLVSGDVNGDGQLDTVDASFIEEYYAWIVDFPLQSELATVYNV